MLTPVDALVDALGWTHDRVEAALEQLADDAARTGQTLHRLRGQVALVRDANAATEGQIEEFVRRHHARSGMKVTEARVLHDIIEQAPTQKLKGNAKQVALQRLRNAGYVTRDENPGLTYDVEFSLTVSHTN